MNKINVCLSPALYDYYKKDDTIVIMVDAVRASASICTAFANGAEKIVTVSEKETAFEYQKKGWLTAGERDGIKIDGFDFGNSPETFSEKNVSGKKIAFTTTNGTRAVQRVMQSKEKNVDLLIGSFLNVNAVAEFIGNKQKDVIVLCSGWKNAVNMEDMLFAGKLISLLKNNYTLLEGANISLNLYETSKNNYYDFIMENSPRLASVRKFLHKDIKYCLQENTTKVVPILKENEYFSS